MTTWHAWRHKLCPTLLYFSLFNTSSMSYNFFLSFKFKSFSVSQFCAMVLSIFVETKMKLEFKTKKKATALFFYKKNSFSRFATRRKSAHTHSHCHPLYSQQYIILYTCTHMHHHLRNITALLAYYLFYEIIHISL